MECSGQWQYRKIIQEMPSPFVTLYLRVRMGRVAIVAVCVVNYANAGTAEHIVSENRSLYFLEMIFRLQVEQAIDD
jgi:acetyl/propionyl-CoA carboxylase alpha subunit